MHDISTSWDEYLRLQASTAQIAKIDSHSWGKEEEMNFFLDNLSANSPNSAERSDRLRRTAARRERSRSQIIQRHQFEIVPESVDPTKYLEAREAVRRIMANLEPAQWQILLAHSMGHNYAEIATERKIAVGTVRIQVFRLRCQLKRAA